MSLPVILIHKQVLIPKLGNPKEGLKDALQGSVGVGLETLYGLYSSIQKRIARFLGSGE